MERTPELGQPDSAESQRGMALVVTDGKVQCPVCKKDIKVGMGGLENFQKHHNPGMSKACQENLRKKIKADSQRAHQQSQSRIQSFFTKQQKVLVPPTVPTPDRVIAYAMESTSSGNGCVAGPSNASAIPDLVPDTLANDLLAKLEKSIRNLPETLPDASETDEIAVFAQNVPTDIDGEDAWELFLDPLLNRFLGFGISVEGISASLRGGEKGLTAMARYLREFVGRYRIDGALLEGKVLRLIEAIEFLRRQSCGHAPSDLEILVISDEDEIYEISSSIQLGKQPCKPQRAKVSVTRSDQSFDARTKSCAGYQLSFPNGQQAHTSYPFALHTIMSLPWDYSIRKGAFVLTSHSCSGKAEVSGRCKACDDLGNNENLKKIIVRYTNGVHESTQLVYHGIAGLIDIVRRKTSTIDGLRLRRLNDARKIVGHEGVIDVHKQMLMALSTQRIPRIDRVLRVAFNHGKGIHSTLELIKKAAEGTYHPKNFDEEDDLQALLFLRLGGARVADIAHRIFGTPSVSVVRTRTTIPQILPSPSFPTRSEIEQNISACFEGLLDLLGTSGQSAAHVVLMFDELAVEKRPRWDDKSNKILGVCREHGQGTSLEFTSEDDLNALWEELNTEKIHLAHEATVGALAVLSPLPRLYSARPILVSGSCKRENANDHASLIQAVVDAANAKKATTGLRVISLASDGESRRGKALAKLTFVAPLAPTSPIYEHLVHLRLLDLFVGADDITADKDYKHVFKRLRNTLLREKGCVVLGIKLTRGLIRRHLQDCGHSGEHITRILDPTDKQDVDLAYKVLKDLWSLPPADPGKSTQTYLDVREALRVYGQLAYHLVSPYIRTELSLSEQLEHLSAAAHLTLALYVHNDARSQFIPNALFCDIGIMIKNAFFCVAKAKADHPMKPFFIVLLGTDRLETLFGILRTMVGNDANLDILQLALRVTATTEVSNILAKHPEWDNGPRRLRLPATSNDSEGIPKSADHISPSAYSNLEKLCPYTLTLATPWRRGRHTLEQKYTWITPILRCISETQDASILAPYGQNLVTNHLTDDDNSDEVEESSSSSRREGHLPHTPLSQDSTSGLQELENAAAEAQWNNKLCDGEGSFSNVVQFGGISMNKSRALAQHFRYITSASSTDRLRRVAQESRFKPTGRLGDSVSGALGDAHTQSPVLSIHQPIATLVLCEQNLFLCIAEVTGLFLDFNCVDNIPLAVLPEKIAQVSYQALRLVPTSYTDDPKGEYDWRSTNLFALSNKVPGALVQPINPAVASHITCNSFFLFQSSILMVIASNLRDHVDRGYRKAIPRVKLTDEFPYREKQGKACFVLDDLSPDTASIEHTGPACTRCQPSVTFNTKYRQRIVEHNGAHILFDCSIDRSMEPCGLCLRPAPLCKIYLRKTKGCTGNVAIDTRASTCSNLIKFSIATAAQFSDASPCTNHPMFCPYCPSSCPAVWSYTFREHLIRFHPTASLKDNESIWAVSDLEEERMKKTWDDRLTQPKARRKTQRPPLVISETHRTRLVLSDKESEPETSDDGSLDDHDREDPEAVPDDDRESGRLVTHRLSGPPEDTLAGFQVAEGFSNIADTEPAEPAPVSVDFQPVQPEGEASARVSERDVSARVSDPEPLFLESEPTRTGRRRKCRDMSGLSQCLCGDTAKPNEEGSIQCQKVGCETIWYHLQCVGYKDLDACPRSWTCDACTLTKRARRR